jgi:hypothetical protein
LVNRELVLYRLGTYAAGDLPAVQIGIDASALRLLDMAVNATVDGGGLNELEDLREDPTRSRGRGSESPNEQTFVRSDGVAAWIDEVEEPVATPAR